MKGDIYHRMARAYWGKQVGVLRDAEIAGWEAVADVFLKYLSGFHGIPPSEIAQARRELGLTEPSRLQNTTSARKASDDAK